MHSHRALNRSEVSEFLYVIPSFITFPPYFFGLDSGGTNPLSR
jgi:hypothetical protein